MTLARFKFRSLFAVFFWLFNLSLLLIVTVYFVTPFGTAMIVDGLRGLVPLSLLVPVFGLVGVPTTSLLMGRWHQRQLKSQDLQSEEPEPVRSEPATTLTLFQIFFGLEAPLLMACTIRLFFLRDLTSVSALVFTSIALGTVVTGRWLSQRRSGSGWISLTGITLMLALSLYISAIALFYAPPIFLIAAVILYHSLYIVVALPILFPFIMLFTGLVIAPWGMVLLFFKTWRGLWRRAVRWSRRLSGGLLALWLVALLLLQQQPQAKAFALLTSPTQSESDHPALLQQSEVIRKGLLNAYLGAYRYPLLNNSDMFNLYSGLLGFSDAAAEVVQGAYNALLSPFAYRGSASDKAEAARLYAEFFDTPILRGEHQAIQKAVLSNFNRTQAKAGLLDIGAERVRLQRQEVTVTPQGDWAEVELHEVYANTTGEDTEILYYFSLPETATVTGLWLGETGDRKLYNPVVATRGAAQQVYNDQVQRRVDPALLEQVGPRNYRLRAFPIPPVGQDLLPEDGQDDRMHLWLTYRVIQQDGQWPLPSLSEQRNVFWDQGTERVINGEGQQESEAWLPASIPIADAGRSPKTVQVALPAGHIVAQPLQSADYQLPSSRRFAVILDTSYSMGEHRQAVAANVQWLEDNLLASNEADFYITSAGDIQARKVDSPDALKEAVFYGAMQTRQMLEQYLAAAGSADYDAILLLTDAGSYELTEDSTPLPLTAPLWLVHVGGFQAVYDDATLETIQRTGGGAVADLETAMTRIATQPSLGADTSLLNVADGYAWFLSRNPYPDAATTDSLAPMAARQWVAQVSQAVQPSDLAQLDAIHQVAKDNSIVTPYSSMLVLVNSAQRQQLKEAENQGDRFEREVEDQQLPDPQGTTVTAVPEPGEWLLLAVCLMLLGVWYAWKRKFTESV